ncbi:MAG: hypothetical protein ACHQEM_03845 [Chitinophagales bacterium]
MKKVQVLAFIIGFILINGCRYRGNTMITSTDGETIEVHYNGEIRFNDDETAIESISPNGFLMYKRNGREFEAQSNSHGEIEYKFYQDGSKVSLDQQDRQRFMAAAIQDLISFGFDSKNRFDKIYQKGGAKAVMAEVARLKGDYIKGVYLEYLLDASNLQPEDLSEIAKKIATAMGSDYDKARLLVKFPVIKDSATTLAYFQAVKTIGSDFERSNAIRHLFDQNLEPYQTVQILLVIKTVGSDFEKSQLLKQFPSRYIYDSINTAPYLDAVKSIGSDFERANAIRNMYSQPLKPDQIEQLLFVANTLGSDFEKANILKELIEKENLDSNSYSKLIAVADGLGSDFEKANILKEMIDKKLFPGESFNNLLNAVNHVNSDFERANILKKLGEKNLETDAQWVALINSCGQIQASFEKSNALIELATRMPKNDQVRSAYMKVAKTIPEDAEFGRVVKAIE